MLIPPEVLPDHVLGLVETVYTLGGKIDPMYIGDVIGENIEVLPYTIDLAEVLGLITYRDGIVTLTETGENIVKSNTKTVVKKLRELASRLQPLKDIVEILKSKGYLEVDEYRNIIMQKYPNNYHKAYQHILIWGAFLRLFKMDEKDSKIIPIDLRSL
ncbi:MAG: AAA-associated domain-containing protein [Desulfurococcus sp.]